MGEEKLADSHTIKSRSHMSGSGDRFTPQMDRQLSRMRELCGPTSPHIRGPLVRLMTAKVRLASKNGNVGTGFGLA